MEGAYGCLRFVGDRGAQLLLLSIAMGLMVATSVTATPPAPQKWDFEHDEIDKRATGFYFDETGDASKATWRVVEEDKNKVLHQSASIQGETPYALAVVHKSQFKDVTLTARIKAGDGNKQPKAGVVWRYRDSENYLVACIDFEDDRIRLYRVVGGNRVQFGRSEAIPLRRWQWYTLRVEHRGERVKVYLDGEAFIIEKDKHYRESGRVGLWTQTESATYFDDFRIQELAKRGWSRNRVRPSQSSVK